MHDSSNAPVLGLFAGGKARRMGGAPKGLLPTPGSGEPIAARVVRIAGEVGLEVVVVGAAPDQALPPSAAALPRLGDDPEGVGPLGGLSALLAYAAERPAIAIACDMPYVSAALLDKLARTPSDAAVLAARDHGSGKWQPLFARYASALVRPVLATTIAEGARSFQLLLRRVSCQELALDAGEHAELRDWDSPEDIER